MTETRIHTHTHTHVDTWWKEEGRIACVEAGRIDRSYYSVLRSMHFINFCHGRMSARPRVAAANLHD